MNDSPKAAHLPIFTIGHSTRTIDAFVHLLKKAGVECVADIRTVPRSRTNPQYNRDSLPASLAPHGIDYLHIEELGGLRPKSHTLTQDINGFWQNQSFHNYADYTATASFQAGLTKLLARARKKRTAMMCAEAVWWRCHRRIVADCLLARGETVFHLMGDDRIVPAKLTPGAVIGPDSAISYPAASDAGPLFASTT